MIAWDLETYLMETGALAPVIVCCSHCERAPIRRPRVEIYELDTWFDFFLNTMTVGCNIAFDLSCVAARKPEHYLPRIFEALEEERIEDVAAREKLLNLAEFGEIDYAPLPSGARMHLSYGLAELENLYLGWDRSAEKKGEDAWRTNYSMLAGKPLEEWPREAIEYSQEDAEGTLLVWEAQEARRQTLQERLGCDPLKTQGLRVMLAFCLRLISCQGFPIDPSEVERISTLVESELAPERMPHLIASGILKPARPGRVFANGKQCKDVPEKLSSKLIREHIAEVYAANGVELTEDRLTDKGAISADKVILEDIYNLSPILEEYHHRQNLLTLRNKELPALQNTSIVYSGYNEMVSSGRTSSRGGQDKDDWPSEQIQNLSRIIKVNYGQPNEYEIDIRPTHVARPGWILYSCDYSSIEFMSVAQMCYQLFGHSRMRDLLLAGIDPHADNAAGMAFDFHDEFRQACGELGATTHDEVREIFLALKGSDDPEERKFFSEWRQLAKPFGFGYWGGMGAKRACETAKKDYKITVSEETAKGFRASIQRRHPEMQEWFHYVERNLQVAPGEYSFTSGFGMHRANLSYTEACNGAMLQTPATGEGAILALTEVVRACYDVSIESCLYGTHVLAFLHDEILGEVPLDGFEHERAQEVARIMVESMKSSVMKDVPVKVEPCLMSRWSKNAKTVFNERGRLIPWVS
jgi:DNA polymerase I